MIAALFYLQYHSVRNRLVTRIKRLKKPKYLVGAIVGGAYFYFYFFRYIFGGGYSGRRQAAVNLTISPEHALLFESLAAFALFVIVVLAWILPHERAALTFTEAEVAFLFPAPITRRTLVHFKLIRSQLGICFSAFLLTLFTRRYGGNAWIHAFGWWMVLSTLNLHLLGSSFARTILLDRGISNWLRRILVSVLALVMVGGLWLWAKNTLPPMNFNPKDPLNSVLDDAQQVLESGPALYLLYPFHLIVRPFFAPDAMTFFAAFAPAFLLLLLHYCWVIVSDVAFEEASLEASQKLATRISAMRAGNWQGAQKKQKARRGWFKLAPNGPPQIALLWKNLIGTGQVFSPRLLIVIAIMLTAFAMVFPHSVQDVNISIISSVIIAAILASSLLLGPQILRLDFRRDLTQADILKTFPLRGWQIALGEILAPITMLAGFQWLLLLIGFALILFLTGTHAGLSLAIGLGAAVLLPLLDGLLLLIPNAAVLLFPSWFQAGKNAPRGVEATGQRLIFAIGQLLVMAVSLVPATAAFAVIFFLAKLAIGSVAAIPIASLAAAIILAVEVGLGVMLLGKLFERFDVTEEPAN